MVGFCVQRSTIVEEGIGGNAAEGDDCRYWEDEEGIYVVRLHVLLLLLDGEL